MLPLTPTHLCAVMRNHEKWKSKNEIILFCLKKMVHK